MRRALQSQTYVWNVPTSLTVQKKPKYTNTNEQPELNISWAERIQRKFHLGKSKKDTGRGKKIYKAEEWRFH